MAALAARVLAIQDNLRPELLGDEPASVGDEPASAPERSAAPRDGASDDEDEDEEEPPLRADERTGAGALAGVALDADMLLHLALQVRPQAPGML